MKNKKIVICISIIIIVLLISGVSLLEIKNFSGKKVDKSTKTTTTVEITTTQEKVENSTELVGITTKISEVKTQKSTTKKTKSTRVTKTTKKVSTNPTKKVNENKETTILDSEPVCKNYKLPNGAVFIKDFGENGISGMSSEFFKAYEDINAFVDKELVTGLNEIESWFEYHSGVQSDGLPVVVYCSDGYTVRGIYSYVNVHTYIDSSNNMKKIAEGFMRSDGSVKWSWEKIDCDVKRCKLKE